MSSIQNTIQAVEATMNDNLLKLATNMAYPTTNNVVMGSVIVIEIIQLLIFLYYIFYLANNDCDCVDTKHILMFSTLIIINIIILIVSLLVPDYSRYLKILYLISSIGKIYVYSLIENRIRQEIKVNKTCICSETGVKTTLGYFNVMLTILNIIIILYVFTIGFFTIDNTLDNDQGLKTALEKHNIPQGSTAMQPTMSAQESTTMQPTMSAQGSAQGSTAIQPTQELWQPTQELGQMQPTMDYDMQDSRPTGRPSM